MGKIKRELSAFTEKVREQKNAPAAPENPANNPTVAEAGE